MSDVDYYYFVLLGNEDGSIEHSVFSRWVGYTKTKPQREIRGPRLVDPQKMRENLSKFLNQSSSIINSIEDFYIFMKIGGNAIIDKNLAETYLPEWFQPEVSIQSFSKGYLFASYLPQQKINHAPSKKVRMNVIKRDYFHCKVCGRSPSEYVDIELHVHHIIPWGIGGITEEDNLITLCNTCHDGLEPHYEPRLFELIGIKTLQDGSLTDFQTRLKLYVEQISNPLSKTKTEKRAI